ncbi:unnamed protein product [Tetraodon nigroviridis]|uniref:(spotted green pufferfish) hypothetical protein n=1 Tax=Tetraodon nigroviridis TaxID=99883 RepID=Q4SD31_TETNG|nr:unnamed protein product [Tetraodon nigroviridis]
MACVEGTTHRSRLMSIIYHCCHGNNKQLKFKCAGHERSSTSADAACKRKPVSLAASSRDLPWQPAHFSLQQSDGQTSGRILQQHSDPETPAESRTDHPERTHCARQGVQTQAEPETAPETRARMPGPGRFPQGAGDGAGPSNRDQTETGGVCKEGKSTQDQAPGEMQRPVRLKPIHSKHPRASLGRSSPSRPPNPPKENHQPLGCTMESRRRLTGLEASGGISPYCLPVINTFVTPVPPPPKRKELGPKVTPSSAHRGRRLRVSTLAPAYEDPPMLRSSVHQSRVSVNMIYFGKKVHLAHDLHDTRDEVKVYQQHCGGENLCVYKGLLHKGERFQFVSRRHRGFPFSLTFFLNGLQVERLSSCCEFKHRRASRLGGRHRHFGFCSVEGASPCYKCIIAIGLDKQPNPPPKRVRENGGGPDLRISSTVPPEAQKAVTGEDDAVPDSSYLEDVETQVREETTAVEGKARSEESEAETDIDRPKESDPEEKCVRQEERTHPDPEGTSEVEPKDSEVQNSAEDSTDITAPDSTGPSGAENNPDVNTEVEKTSYESKEEEDLERDRSQKTNEGEDSKSVKDESEEEEKEAIDVDEKTSKMCEKDRKNETDESRAEQTEAGEKNSGNCEKEEEGGTVNSDELGKNTDADSAKDMKKPEENVVETEDETVREASGGETENGDIDAENGEISSRTESVTHKDAKEAETEAQTDVETGKHTGNEIKTDEVTEEERAEATDLTAEPGDGPEKHRCEQMDPTPDAGSAKSDALDEESNGGGPGTEIKESERCNFPEEDNEILTQELRTEATSGQPSAPEDRPLSPVTELTDKPKPSKASEGASVVLNPRASFPDEEECPSANPEIAEIVDTGENVDLVSNWVTTHQVAKFFETFVEPLDDLKEKQVEGTQGDQSAVPLSSGKMVDNPGLEETKEEAGDVEREGDVFETSKRSEKDPREDKHQEQEETEVMDLILEKEPSEKELPKGLPVGSDRSRTSLQNDKDQEGFVQNNTQQDRVSTPEVKDRLENHRPVSRGSPEHQPELDRPDLNHKPTPVLAFRAPSETDQGSQRSAHPEEPSQLKGNLNAEEMWGASEKVIEAEITWERTPEEPGESVPEPPGTSTSGQKTDLQLMADLRHSKDRLSVTSLHDTHFGRSSYPLLAAARTQNGQ